MWGRADESTAVARLAWYIHKHAMQVCTVPGIHTTQQADVCCHCWLAARVRCICLCLTLVGPWWVQQPLTDMVPGSLQTPAVMALLVLVASLAC